jgi:DNA polymerase-3 subunit gamma/tau
MPVSVPTPSSPPGSLDATALRRLWPEVLDVVKLTSRRTRALLDNAQIVDVAGELVSLSAPAALARMISEESNATVLRQALTKVVGGEWRIDVHAANGATAAPAASERRTPSAADPGGDVRREVRDDPTDDAGDDVDVESDQSDARPAPLDPEAQAMRLLQDQLGARPVEEG